MHQSRQEFLFKVADNTGVKYAKMVSLKKTKRVYPKLGDFATVFPKVLTVNSWRYPQAKKKRRYTGLVLGLRCLTRRMSGIGVRAFSNRIVLFSEQMKFLGTRVYGPTCREVKFSEDRARFRKVVVYARGYY